MAYLKFLTLSLVLLFFFPSTAFAEGPRPLSDLNSVFENAVSVVALVGGMFAFLALIFGGFKYIMARGDPKATAGAQGTITWAIIGLALIIVSWLVLVFIKAFTGVNVTDFLIPE